MILGSFCLAFLVSMVVIAFTLKLAIVTFWSLTVIFMTILLVGGVLMIVMALSLTTGGGQVMFMGLGSENDSSFQSMSKYMQYFWGGGIGSLVAFVIFAMLICVYKKSIDLELGTLDVNLSNFYL